MGNAAYEGETVTVYDSILWSYINKLNDGCITTRVKTYKNTKDCKLFPNPANQFFIIYGFAEDGNYTLFYYKYTGQLQYEDDTNKSFYKP